MKSLPRTGTPPDAFSKHAVNPSLEARPRRPASDGFENASGGVPPHSTSPRHQRGVALITAVLIVALATILATQIGFDSALEQRRSAGVLLLDQAFQVGLGAEAWAASYLKDDAAKTTDDHLAENWATPIPPIPIDGGFIEGQMEDLQGRFNLNNLIDVHGEPNGEPIREFKNLLAVLELEPKWADLIVDWLDNDTQPIFPDGGEDSVYLSQAPPYRTPNAAITSASELLALPGFGLERYQKLRPHVTALPVGTKINVCTATGAVLDALDESGIAQFSIDPEGLAKNRERGCFPTVNDFLATVSPNRQSAVQEQIAATSSYFGLRAFVTIGTTEFSLYSLLYREPNTSGGLVRPVMRNFGAE
jgi:general secretion pathway protein K